MIYVLSFLQSNWSTKREHYTHAFELKLTINFHELLTGVLIIQRERLFNKTLFTRAQIGFKKPKQPKTCFCSEPHNMWLGSCRLHLNCTSHAILISLQRIHIQIEHITVILKFLKWSNTVNIICLTILHNILIHVCRT